MLRDIVVHIVNEQPLRADMLFEPLSTDNVLVCRNLRTMNGKKPIMADHADSLFMIPLAQVRFVEIPQAAVDGHMADMAAEAASETRNHPFGRGDAAPSERLGRLTDGRRRVDSTAPPTHSTMAGGEVADRLDDDLLRRIREI
jgi:hypothetical protein